MSGRGLGVRMQYSTVQYTVQCSIQYSIQHAGK